MSPETFLQQVLNGLMLGSIYALLALGYTMVYGVLKLINFAHGDILMIGAYLGLVAATRLETGLLPTMLLAMAGCALIGMLIERFAYRPLRNAPTLTALITAMGVSLFLENAGILTVGANPQAFPRDVLMPEFRLDLPAGLPPITNRQVFIVVTALVLMGLLYAMVSHTRMGKAMRAVAFDKDAARLMGIPVNRVISFTFALGSALAAAGGILYSLYYGSLTPQMGIYPGLKAFVAAVLGGIGSVPGAMLGGVLLGFTEATFAYYWSTWRDALAFALLIVVLLVRPQGIMGRSGAEKV